MVNFLRYFYAFMLFSIKDKSHSYYYSITILSGTKSAFCFVYGSENVYYSMNVLFYKVKCIQQ